MSKFDEMCGALATARKNWRAFRDRCYQDMGTLVHGFIQYCEIPEGQVEFRNLQEAKEGLHYTLPGAMHLADDGLWHLGLLLTLYTSTNAFPRQPLLIEFCVSEQSGRTMVKAGFEDKPRAIDLANQAERERFYDAIVGEIKNYFTTEPQLDDAASLKRIGFRSDVKNGD
jgi:hypothetical protein